MPGLAGFTNRKLAQDAVAQTVVRMCDSLIHEKHHVSDGCFVTPQLSAGRVHTGIIQLDQQPAACAGVKVWLDGEIYNQHALMTAFGISGRPCCDAQLLARLYQADPEMTFLRRVDGIYAAIFYDKAREQVHIATDRYGLRHLYYLDRTHEFAWASEVKSFLEIPGFVAHISEESIADFLSAGHLLDDRTWFSGVRLLAAGTILTLNLHGMTIRTRKYWTCEEVRPLRGATADEILEEVGRLFLASVRRQSDFDGPVGVSLSGGLDSRALLAAIPRDGREIHSVTFGRPGCDDVQIAAQAAQVRPAVHHVVDLTSANWIRGRVSGIWRCDGQYDMLHMHALVAVDEQRKNYKINLNGFLGDAVLGGSYHGDKRWTIAEKVNQRGRRFINEGTRLTNNFLHNRLPFFANDLMEFTCSIPESMRTHSRIYNRMLLRMFPEYFKSIVWQRTGLPITYSPELSRLIEKARTLQGLIKALLTGEHKSSQAYSDYPAWIRQEPARSLFQSLLLSPKSLYREFTALNVAALWNDHMNGVDRSQPLCRIFTFEIWLQQVFERKYR